MIFQLIDRKIRQAFSQAAIQYDVLASLHKEIGRELVKKILPTDPCRRILDIGMGTGWLTGRMAYYFPESQVVGLDFAQGMVEYARKAHEGFQIIQADARSMPFKAESFDVIASNLAFQWIPNLTHVFESCRRNLHKDGRLCLTLFGHRTFEELFTCLDQSKPCRFDTSPLPIRRLVDCSGVEQALRQAGFSQSSVDYEIIKVHFPDMMALMKWIRNIGANHLGEDLHIGKEWFVRANDRYDQMYRDRLGIISTFEVIWVDARK